jgi:hypothetical protein
MKRNGMKNYVTFLKASFHNGTAYHLIGSSLVDADGNEVQLSGCQVWINFLKWCNSEG